MPVRAVLGLGTLALACGLGAARAEEPGAMRAFGAAVPAETGATAIAERVQVIYDPATGEVARRLVRVVDPNPELGLEFSWEPGAGVAGLDAEGFATGAGTLTWRIPGAPAYDPRSFHSRFTGTLSGGAPTGPGRLSMRDGSWREGSWDGWTLSGKGRAMDAAGSLYEGQFRAGLPEGEGILRHAEGWIYSGAFRNGLPDGAGHMRLPGGQEFDVVMKAGKEVSSTRPEVIADATLGGLLPAQGGGGEAGKVQLSVVTDARVSLEQDIVYTHYNSGAEIQIYPQDEGLLNSWNGTGRTMVPYQFFDYGHEDWLKTRAFLDLTLATSDASKVRLKSLDLVVDQSAPHLKPMLDTVGTYGCIGHRPWFTISNHGWGPVENPTLKVQFVQPDSYQYDTGNYTPAGDWVDVPISGFDEGTSVDMRPVLAEAGVDMATLSRNRFWCPSTEEMETCSANLLKSVDFGTVSGLIANGQQDISVEVGGQLDYDWHDAWGNVQHQSERFMVTVELARIEAPPLMAEMGAGGAFATPAPEFQEIELQTQGAGYRVPIPQRGNPNIDRLEAHVQLFADRSSYHAFHFEATFGDGSVRSSGPLALYYISPRKATYASEIPTGACYLAGDY